MVEENQFLPSFITRVWPNIFELDEVSISNFVKFWFQRMNLKNERVFEKTNKMLCQKLAKMAMNLVTKKEQYPNANFLNWGKNTFICKIISVYTINNLCVVIEISAT